MDFEKLKLTAMVNAFSAIKIPLLAFITPNIIELDDKRSVVRVRLDFRTRNHLKVMYFGALAMGAELSIAAKCVQAISQSGKRIDFLFKDFKAEFLKRADGHTHFVCEEADKVAALVHKAAASSDRQEATFKGYAFVPANSAEPVMKYQLTLSMKKRGQ
jgi:acyl-coenzyme A thioesterase PaaI-like protein